MYFIYNLQCVIQKCVTMLVVQRKFPWDIWLHLKTPQYGGMWEQQPVTHFHQGKMLFQRFTARGLTNTLNRHKGSCHQNEMRIAVGGPILASCLLLFRPGLGGCPGNHGVANKTMWNNFQEALCTKAYCCCHFSLHFFKNKCIYFWLHWIFVAAHGLSLVEASRGYSSLWCAGFLLWWLLLLQSMGSRRTGFSSCGMKAQQLGLAGSRAQVQQLWCTGLTAPRHVGSSLTRARTHAACIGRQILNH